LIAAAADQTAFGFALVAFFAGGAALSEIIAVLVR
jgi:hypothetical protein